jgi:hypothetical protein
VYIKKKSESRTRVVLKREIGSTWARLSYRRIVDTCDSLHDSFLSRTG